MSESAPPIKFSDIVCVIPAAGKGSRLKGLRFSKELYPLIPTDMAGRAGGVPRAVCEFLFHCVAKAGVKKTILVIRDGKWDIPSAFGDGSDFGLSIAYQTANWPYGVPFTIDTAYDYVCRCLVVFGFPDIVFEPRDAFQRLISKLKTASADIVLGLFPTDAPSGADMAAVEADGTVSRVHIKPTKSELGMAWAIAVWTPKFTEYLHRHCQNILQAESPSADKEFFLGDVINSAINSGLRVRSVSFNDGWFVDAGTPNGLYRAHELLSESSSVR